MQVTFEFDDVLFAQLTEFSQQQNLSLNELTARLYRQLVQNDDISELTDETSVFIHPELLKTFGKYHCYAKSPTVTVDDMNEGIAKFHQTQWAKQ